MTTAKKTKRPPSKVMRISRKTAERNHQSDLDPILEDWKWTLDQYKKGRLNSYLGQHIAVANGQILGSAVYSIELRNSVAKKHQLDPERLVIFCVE